MLWPGIVVNNDDSQLEHPHLGRVQVRIPQLHGNETAEESLPWAWPCLPFAGSDAEGIKHAALILPEIGDGIWITFVQDDPDFLVWLGGWLGERDKQSELHQDALSDETSGEVYPNIREIRLPGGMNLRFVGTQRAELNYDTEHGIVLDSQNKTMLLRGGDWKIQLETTGEIVISGESIRLVAGSDEVRIGPSNRIALSSGEGEIEVYAEGSVKVASKETLYGSAPHACGFENH